MRGFWQIGACCLVLSCAAAHAELYRWTDDAGKTHITDNPATIPPAYRHRVRAPDTAPVASPEAPPRPGAPSEPVTAPQRVPQPTTPESSASGTSDASIAELEQQLQVAQQERQAALERLRGERAVHVTPEFIRQRRTIADTGRSLAALEQRITELSTALAAKRRQAAPPTTPTASQTVIVDRDGHDATYWRRVVGTARERLQQAHTQRQTLLERLGTATESEGRAAQRRGREVLQHARTLEQLTTEINAAQAALDLLYEEARQAGAPAAWLE